MDWDRLRVFLAVARAGQILGAARRLGLNHATVARQLDALEAGLGTMLVERGPSGCTLTAAGERLAATAERMEAEALAAEAELAEGGGGVSGTVRVGAPDGLGNYFLAPELAPPRQSTPGPRRRTGAAAAHLLAVEARGRRRHRARAARARPPRRDEAHRLHARRLRHARLPWPPTASRPRRRSLPATSSSPASTTSPIRRRADYAAAFEGTAAARFHCASVVGQVEAIRRRPRLRHRPRLCRRPPAGARADAAGDHLPPQLLARHPSRHQPQRPRRDGDGGRSPSACARNAACSPRRDGGKRERRDCSVSSERTGTTGAVGGNAVVNVSRLAKPLLGPMIRCRVSPLLRRRPIALPGTPPIEISRRCRRYAHPSRLPPPPPTRSTTARS